MANIKTIRSKIKSVQSTRKITKAMEMVAASKMRHAQERMRAARPYADKVREIAARMSCANTEYEHPFLLCHPQAKIAGVVLVTTDKGLCGALNTNILRLTLAKFKALEQQGCEIEVTAIGSKGVGFLGRVGASLGAKIVSQVVQLGDTPHLDKLIGAVKVQLDAYQQGTLSAVYLAYTRFINTMKQEPVIEQLLPLTDQHFNIPAIPTPLIENQQYQQYQHQHQHKPKPKRVWEYLYEPDPQSVVDKLLVRYVEALIYQAAIETSASEQSARMVAMKAASDNAKTVIEDLELIYNKSRQAAITRELSEIVSGAAAV